MRNFHHQPALQIKQLESHLYHSSYFLGIRGDIICCRLYYVRTVFNGGGFAQDIPHRKNSLPLSAWVEIYEFKGY